MPDPFRTVVQRCGLCEVEGDQLELLAGVPMCAVCRTGEVDDALARHALSCTVKELHPTRATLWRTVEVVRPTILDLAVKCGPDTPRGWLRRRLGQGDPEVGDPGFDDRVKVEPADDSFTELALRVLRSPGVPQAVLAVIDCGGSVELVGRTVWVRAERSGDFGHIPELATLKLLAVALAIAVERFAREPSR